MLDFAISYSFNLFGEVISGNQEYFYLESYYRERSYYFATLLYEKPRAHKCGEVLGWLVG